MVFLPLASGAFALLLSSCGCSASPSPAALANVSVAPVQEPVQSAPGAPAVAAAAVKPPASVYFIGHSLIADVPDFVAHFAAAAGVRPFAFKEQFILGSPLRWQWLEVERAAADGYQSPFRPPHQASYFEELPKGTHDALVLVDSVPRGGPELEAESTEYLLKFTQMARAANPGVRVLFYEPWHCIHSGTPAGCDHDKSYPTTALPWRERVEADAAMWTRIVAAANAKLPTDEPPIESIPVARALGLLADAIGRGEVEGFTNWQELFADDIHLSNPGKFFAALVTYAALFRKAPGNFPIAAKNRWGSGFWNEPNWQGKAWPAPTPAAARRMGEIAAQALGLPAAEPSKPEAQ